MVKIITKKMKKKELAEIAKKGFGSVVKIAVDVKKRIIALGGEWHSDCQERLIKDGSQPQDIWGANIYLDLPNEKRLEFVP